MTYVLTILSSGSRQKKFARASPRAVWMKIKQTIRRSEISQIKSGRMNESIRTEWAGIGRLARPTTRTAWKTKLSTDVSQAKLEARDGQKLTELTLHKNLGLLRWNSSNHKTVKYRERNLIPSEYENGVEDKAIHGRQSSKLEAKLGRS